MGWQLVSVMMVMRWLKEVLNCQDVAGVIGMWVVNI